MSLLLPSTTETRDIYLAVVKEMKRRGFTARQFPYFVADLVSKAKELEEYKAVKDAMSHIGNSFSTHLYDAISDIISKREKKVEVLVFKEVYDRYRIEAKEESVSKGEFKNLIIGLGFAVRTGGKNKMCIYNVDLYEELLL